MLIETAFLCLALNIYHEARGEPIMGQYGVALVTLNRAKSEEQVCKETFRKHQFSWTGGVVRVQAGWQLPAHMRPKLSDPIEAHAWKTAKIIAGVTLAGRMPDFTRGADHYHATYVRPRWARAMNPVKQIGQHIFYTRPQAAKR